MYSTCSLEAEECEGVVDSVVGAGGVVRLPVDGVMAELVERGVLSGEMRSAVRDGTLRTLPGVHGCDGFFASVKTGYLLTSL